MHSQDRYARYRTAHREEVYEHGSANAFRKDEVLYLVILPTGLSITSLPHVVDDVCIAYGGCESTALGSQFPIPYTNPSCTVALSM